MDLNVLNQIHVRQMMGKFTNTQSNESPKGIS